jgi:hypothetical protein
MWHTWAPPDVVRGRNAVLVSFTEDKLKWNRITEHFKAVGDISKELLTDSSGNDLGYFYWRFGYGYDPLNQ